MAEITELKNKRKNIKARLTNFKNYLDSIKDIPSLTNVQVNELLIKTDKMKSMFDDFDKLQDRIELLTPDNTDAELAERDLIENNFVKYIAIARTCIPKSTSKTELDNSNASFHTDGQNDTIMSTSKAPVAFKLPQIQITKFDGLYSRWLEFRDTFKSLIHSNERLMDVHKYHYLLSYLEGEAAGVLSNLEVSAANYSQAWALLCARYDNKTQLINKHLNSLFNIESIFRESDKSLRAMIDNINKDLRALSSLGQPTDKWDTLIIHMASQKLDIYTSEKWEEQRKQYSEMPTLEQFFKFLNDRADVIENRNKNAAEKYKNNTSTPVPKYYNNKYEKIHTKSFSCTTQEVPNSSQSQWTCVVCKGAHNIYDCQTFLSKSPAQRIEEATKLKLCLNCLRKGHTLKYCRLGPCRECRKRHNTLLHKVPSVHPSTSSVSAPAQTDVAVNFSSQPTGHVMLSTAIIQVVNPSTKKSVAARCLLDCGSQSSFMTTDLKNKLGLKSTPINTTKVLGIGNTPCNYITELCNVELKSLQSNFNVNIACSILPELTGNIPKSSIKMNHFQIPTNINLADPKFNESAPIDLLIGADLFWNVIGNEQRSLGSNKPFLRSSRFGWIISGPIILNCEPTNIQCNFTRSECIDKNNLDSQISKFWELEEVPKKSLLSDSEKACEEHFKTHTTRLESGRFSVSLPLKESPNLLGESYQIAKKQFLSLERRFQKQPELKKSYCEFIQEYIDLGHCTRSEVEKPTPSYFLRHHAVLREQSESTKLRVVFNGSGPTSTGVSINDLQMVGPTIQDSLFSILLRFRQHKFVLSGDIEKMFRQVALNESDRNFQLILWRDDPSKPISTLRLNTVTYGFASASFLTTRCLHQLGEESSDEMVKTIIQKDFYCDDLLTGADSEQDLVKILKSVTATLKSGCFNLRKFRSNLPTIFEASEINLEGNLSLSDSSSALGLGWNPNSDNLHFIIDVPKTVPINITKRQILSTSFSIYDPLGVLSVCTVQTKILMQQLWIRKLDWDEPVPHDLRQEWEKMQSSFPSLSSIQLPRHVLCDAPKNIELHSFCDASCHAYGACVYLRSSDNDGNITVRLLCAKSKVAPVKPKTIPRLELCGALLAARLCKVVLESLRCQISRCVHWCDSSVVIGWLNTSPNKLKTFVANRVVEIAELTNLSSWRHVPTSCNPADHISRGVNASQLQDLQIWWSGPSFLSDDESTWPVMNKLETKNNLPETKSHTLQTQVEEPIIKFENYSKFTKLQRTFAYVLRYIHNLKVKKTNPTKILTGYLTSDELNKSLLTLAKLSQKESFPDEYRALSSGRSLSTKCNILSLTPVMDEHKVMRVGGRLSMSNYSYNKKHPIILHSNHHLTKLFFQYEHIRHMHAGPQLLLCAVRETVWPVSGRVLARRTVHNCVTCRRHKGQTVHPMMGNLPSQRITPAFPFQTVSMDFAGPFSILNRKGRGAKTSKCYLCLFVCFRYKCVHLEAVTELSKEAFILALRRFISRRGKPLEIFSDNGRNFVAAAKDLGNFLKLQATPISDFGASEGIKFNFAPAYAPHFSGLSEAGIKSAKYHIKRVMGNSNLTYEELSTLFAQVEAILNSRPLCPISSSPHDFLSLTPGHFLVGRPLTSLPSPALEDYSLSSLSRYARLEQIRQHFWSRWQKEYIGELQQRTKWRTNRAKLHIGDMVLIQEDNVPPLNWRLGRISNLVPGPDGIPRVADIETARGSVRRALTRICPLPTQDELDS